MNRRRFLHASAAALGALTTGCAGRAAVSSPWAVSFDREVEAFMSARKIPGGALAVVRNRRLVYARGYGWADGEAKVPARPESLFRIASVSKPVTGVAVMKLVEDGRLKLDAPAFTLLGLQPAIASFRDPEPRLRAIAVRQLLQHTGGWDLEKSFDPMCRPRRIAEAIHVPARASVWKVIRCGRSQP